MLPARQQRTVGGNSVPPLRGGGAGRRCCCCGGRTRCRFPCRTPGKMSVRTTDTAPRKVGLSNGGTHDAAAHRENVLVSPPKLGCFTAAATIDLCPRQPHHDCHPSPPTLPSARPPGLSGRPHRSHRPHSCGRCRRHLRCRGRASICSSIEFIPACVGVALDMGARRTSGAMIYCPGSSRGSTGTRCAVNRQGGSREGTAPTGRPRRRLRSP